jgi:hypothetical protein
MAQPSGFTHFQVGLARQANLLFNAATAASAGGKIRLCTSAANYTATSTAIANELSGNGYPAGGLSLTVSTSAWNTASNHHRVSFSDVILTPTANVSFRFAVLTDAGNNLIGFWSWTADENLIANIQYPFQSLYYFTRNAV